MSFRCLLVCPSIALAPLQMQTRRRAAMARLRPGPLSQDPRPDNTHNHPSHSLDSRTERIMPLAFHQAIAMPTPAQTATQPAPSAGPEAHSRPPPAENGQDTKQPAQTKHERDCCGSTSEERHAVLCISTLMMSPHRMHYDRPPAHRKHTATAASASPSLPTSTTCERFGQLHACVAAAMG